MSKQTAVEWLWNELKACNVNIASDLVAQFNQAKQMEKEQMKEYADYAIKQLHETGICFYDEFGNLEDVKGGDHE
jgi:hypothetical protein